VRNKSRLRKLEQTAKGDGDEFVTIDYFWDDGQEYIGSITVPRCKLARNPQKPS
jgi:hypothetical protein